MRPGYTNVVIGRSTIEVPIYIDPSTSQTIADQIAQRIDEQEQEGGRIDTVAYTLRTAYEYAIRLQEIEEEASQTESMTHEALQKLLSRLKDILQELPAPQEPEQA